MTLRELAKQAGVSVSTVSKAFSDAKDVGSETKQRIYKIAKEHGCYEKYYKGKFPKKIIAIIYSEIEHFTNIKYVSKLEKLLEQKGYITILSVYNNDPDKQMDLLDFYASYLRVDGIIVFDLKNKLKKGYTVPIVSVFSDVDCSIDHLIFDRNSYFKNILHTLNKYGHTRLAFISEQRISKTNTSFLTETKKYLQRPVFFYVSPFFSEEAGIDGIKHLLDEKVKCTAIVCAYDEIALGAISELKANGYQIPEDYSVIGMNNIGAYLRPEVSLSSVAEDIDSVCNQILELLERKLRNNYLFSKQEIIISREVIIRGSIAKLEKSKEN